MNDHGGGEVSVDPNVTIRECRDFNAVEDDCNEVVG